jgi:phosphoglycerate dehydrogenase-like enzyme
LRDGVIGGAALDTWWRYPSGDDPAPRPSRYPFHELPNVIMTPHCSPRTDGTIERRSRDVAETSTALFAASRSKTSLPRPEN